MKKRALLVLCCSLINVGEGYCPRRGQQPLEEGRLCKKRECKTDADCRAESKGCYCDSECGKSCFNRNFTCGEPQEIADGSVRTTRLGLGGEARYSCNDGYALRGRRTRKCNADKRWGGHEPVCERGCSRPFDVPYSFPSSDDDTFLVGEPYEFLCNTGYFMYGNSTRICESEGGWTDAEYSCRIKKCDVLPDVYNGRIVFTRKNKFGSTAKVVCDEGYEATSDAVKRCHSGDSYYAYGEWTGSFPTCRIITCGEPEVPNHGSIPYLEQLPREYGTRINYRCDVGYKIKGSETGKCNKDRNWGEVPECIENPDCHFSKSASPFCGYTSRNWRRVLTTDYQGLNGYAAESGVGSPVLESIALPGGWAEEFICLSFLYKLSPEKSLHVESADSDSTSFLTTHQDEISSNWLNSAVTLSTRSRLKFQFRTNGRGILLDDVTVVPEACDDNCESAPCQNDGTCFNRINYYTCFCTKNFEGRHCENDLRCPNPPPQIEHGFRVSLSPTPLLPSTSAVYECDRGYGFEDGKGGWSTSRKIQCNREQSWTESRWSTDPSNLRCEDLRCANPPLEIEHGSRVSLSQTLLLPSTSAVYECDRGYSFEDGRSTTKDIQCLRTRYSTESRWSVDPSNLRCDEILCEIPASANNRRLMNPKPKWPAGDMAEYRCRSGYIAANKEHINATCQLDGIWTNPPPQCIRPPHCTYRRPSGQNLATVVNQLAEYPVGTSVYFKCKAGYRISGPPSRRCTEMGTWDESHPRCRKAQCPSRLPSIPNGGYKPPQNNPPYTYGNSIKFECNEGYFLRVPGKISCLWDGTWSKPSECTEIKCPSPPGIPNGRYLWKRSPTKQKRIYTYGDTIIFVCNAGYFLPAPGKIRCLWNGTWSEKSECTAVFKTCRNDWTPPENSRIVQRREGRIDFMCNPSYEPQDKFRVHCGPGRQWQGEIPVCRAPGLCQPNPCQNGGRCTWNQRRTSCRCTEKYTGEYCETEIKCDSSTLVNKGFKPLPQLFYSVGDRVPLICNEEYRAGHTETTCRSNRQWEDTASCEEINCEHPGLPDRGLLENGIQPYQFGDVIYIGCKAGFELEGNGIMQCQRDGTWTELRAQCREITCDQPRLPPEAYFTPEQESFSVGASVDVFCNEGYEMDGERSLECQDDKTWSPSEAHVICNIRRDYPCSPPDLPENSVFTDDSRQFPSGRSITFECLVGYSITEGDPTWSCDNGIWTKSGAGCVVDEPCLEPDIPKHSYIEGGIDAFPSGSSISLVCRGGRRISGDRTWSCHNGNWIKTDVTCNAQDCVLDPVSLGLYGFAVEGEELVGDQRFSIDTKLTLTCLDGGTPTNFDEETTPPIMACQDDGRWSPGYEDFMCEDAE